MADDRDRYDDPTASAVTAHRQRPKKKKTDDGTSASPNVNAEVDSGHSSEAVE